mgnify:FL=1
MPGNKKKEALMKTFTKEKVAVIHSAFEDAPTTVAFVEVDKVLTDMLKCEVAFKLTNNIEDAWWKNEEVTPMFDGKTCRSTSVGDMVLVGKTKYKFLGTETVVWEKV